MGAGGRHWGSRDQAQDADGPSPVRIRGMCKWPRKATERELITQKATIRVSEFGAEERSV